MGQKQASSKFLANAVVDVNKGDMGPVPQVDNVVVNPPVTPVARKTVIHLDKGQEGGAIVNHGQCSPLCSTSYNQTNLAVNIELVMHNNNDLNYNQGLDINDMAIQNNQVSDLVCKPFINEQWV